MELSMKDKGFKWISRGKRREGLQERIDLATGMAQSINPVTGVTEYYKLVCPKCGKIIEREDQSKSWDWKIYARERYVHRCRIKDKSYCTPILTLSLVVPPDMTLDELYKCVRFGMLHKDEALSVDLPTAPPDEHEDHQITLEEYYSDAFGKEVE